MPHASRFFCFPRRRCQGFLLRGCMVLASRRHRINFLLPDVLNTAGMYEFYELMQLLLGQRSVRVPQCAVEQSSFPMPQSESEQRSVPLTQFAVEPRTVRMPQCAFKASLVPIVRFGIEQRSVQLTQSADERRSVPLARCAVESSTIAADERCRGVKKLFRASRQARQH